jgi:hypothetical protein
VTVHGEVWICPALRHRLDARRRQRTPVPRRLEVQRQLLRLWGGGAHGDRRRITDFQGTPSGTSYAPEANRWTSRSRAIRTKIDGSGINSFKLSGFGLPESLVAEGVVARNPIIGGQFNRLHCFWNRSAFSCKHSSVRRRAALRRAREITATKDPGELRNPRRV